MWSPSVSSPFGSREPRNGSRGQTEGYDNDFSPINRERSLIDRLRRFDVVIVPGLDNSDELHWQSQWENFWKRQGVSVQRVKQDDWSRPQLSEWRKELHAAISRCTRPVLLVAHSLGALLTAHCADLPVAGALLVAPADVEETISSQVSRISGFTPLPSMRLAFPAVMVASQNDEWLSFTRATLLARQWGASLFPAGWIGHIGNRENLGFWPDGFRALDVLLERIRI
ncbi:RBBP9/YdeN family alpha/beta hydrolase [Acetobacter conturbans]|uniref:Alpha/beta fold hydrolase n=1 Tax=Acetobacter conturbans TaxID=1737472 RepID=A0ABX0K3F0_9PROT|nr:alpha/beta hydrolase [Acetobacter conturbans]NHN88848.1 alpha/beta fold hydrolase [Acetobacter conturbans]